MHKGKPDFFCGGRRRLHPVAERERERRGQLAKRFFLSLRLSSSPPPPPPSLVVRLLLLLLPICISLRHANEEGRVCHSPNIEVYLMRFFKRYEHNCIFFFLLSYFSFKSRRNPRESFGRGFSFWFRSLLGR